MPNQWNDLLQGLIEGGTALAGGIIKKNTDDRLQGLMQSHIKALDNILNPQPQTNEGTTSTGGQYETQTTPQVDNKALLQELFKGQSDFVPYGKEGEQYANLLQSYFNVNQPQKPELKTVGNNLIEVYKNPKTGEYESKPIFQGEGKTTPFSQEKPTIIKNADGTYSMQSFWNQDGKLQSKTDPIDNVTGERLYERQQSDDANKNFTKQEQMDYADQLKRNFRIDFNIGGNKKTGSTKPTIPQKQLLSKIKSLNNYNTNFAHLTHAEKDTRRKLELEVMEQLQTDEKGAFDKVQQIANGTDKEANTKLSRLYNPEQEQKRQTKIVDIGKQIQSSFDELNNKLRSGEITPEIFTQTIQEWFNDHKNNLPDEITSQLMRLFKDNNLNIK